MSDDHRVAGILTPIDVCRAVLRQASATPGQGAFSLDYVDLAGSATKQVAVWTSRGGDGVLERQLGASMLARHFRGRLWRAGSLPLRSGATDAAASFERASQISDREAQVGCRELAAHGQLAL